MNKLTLNKGKTMILPILICLFLGQSCRKDLLMPSADKIGNARRWYTMESNKFTNILTSSKGDSIPIKIDVDWSNVKIEKINNTTEVFFVSLNEMIPNKGLNPVLLIRNIQNKWDFKIINNKTQHTDNSKLNYLNTTTLYENAYVSSINQNSSKTNKNDRINSNSETSIDPILNTTSTESPDLGKCTDWYLITDYGNGVVTEQFVGRTCLPDKIKGGSSSGESGDGNPDHQNGDYGEDTDCLNCRIKEVNFADFLKYLQSFGYEISNPFATTLTVNGTKYPGIMIEIYSLNGNYLRSFFKAANNSDLFQVDMYYNIGNKGPDGNYSPIWEPGIGLIPTNPYYNDENRIPGGGSITYTPYYITQLINLLNIENGELKLFLLQNPISNDLFNYLVANGNTSENRDYLIWVCWYLIENQHNININDFKNQFLPIKEIIANPDVSNWTAPDNEILNDTDQTVYQQYQNTHPWPNIKQVIKFEDFVPNRYKPGSSIETVNCLDLAKEQLDKKGYTVSGYYIGSSQIFQAYTESNGVDPIQTRLAITYMIETLAKGIPILAGIDVNPGAPLANKDNSTDHFIVIVGTGTDTKGKYFQFMDSSTNYPTLGASQNNKLYFDPISEKITGKTMSQYGTRSNRHDFILTHIRKSIKK